MSCPDCIPVMVLKNCEPILAELFTICLKECCFPDCLKVSLWIPIFKNFWERSTAKTTTLLVFFLWLVKSLKNLKNNRIVDHLEKCSLFSYFQSSQSIADLLAVVSDRIARAFNRSGATQAVARDISKAFDRV